MERVPSDSIDLIVTSPPYNARIQYDEHNDNMSLEEYLAFLMEVWGECYRVLKDGGRIAINVNQIDRQPCIPLYSYITQQMLELGFLSRGVVIWDKGASVGPSTAWGSWRKPTNPILRDTYEFVLVFTKGSFKIAKQDVEPDIERDEFLEWSKSIWHINTVSAKKIGHPAPFPVELPKRLIKFYTYPGATVLDPFMGSGTTAIAAKQLGRHYVGYDISEAYIALAKERITELDAPKPETVRKVRKARKGKADDELNSVEQGKTDSLP